MDADWLKAQFLEYPDKTKADLARALGLESPAISKILNETRQIKAKEYEKMRHFFGLPTDGERAIRSATINEQTYVVERLGSALREDEQDTPQSQWMIPAEIVQNHTKAQPGQLKSFQVTDNMMSPDFAKGEHVLVDLSDTTPSPPGPFILSDGFGYLLRQCEFVPGSNPAQIRITTRQNPAGPKILSEEGYTIIGRVSAKLQWL